MITGQLDAFKKMSVQDGNSSLNFKYWNHNACGSIRLINGLALWEILFHESGAVLM